MDLKAVQRVLRLSYGLQGIERRKLLQPLVDSARVQTLSPLRLAASLSGMGSKTATGIIDASHNTKTTDTTTTASIPDQSPSTIPVKSTGLSTEQLATLLAESIQQPQPLFYKKARTIPPIYSDPVATLIKHTTGKPIQPTLPEPLFKPLHGKREANLRWRFFSKQMSKLKPPLPAEIRQEMEWKSCIGMNRLESSRMEGSHDGVVPKGIVSAVTTTSSGGSDVLSLAFTKWEDRILKTIKAWNKNGQEQKQHRFEIGRFHPSIGGKPAKSNTLTPRLYRRIWRQLLDEVTVLDINVITDNKDHGTRRWAEEDRSLPPPRSKVAFLPSKSPESHQLRATVGIREMAVVNDYDRIGFVESISTSVSRQKNKKK